MIRACGACGHVGSEWQVRARVIEIPKAEQIPVTVMIPVTFRDGAIEEPRRVPGIYGAELRCTDARACAERVAEAELAPEPMPTAPEPPAHATAPMPEPSRIPPPEDIDVSAWT